MNKFIIKLITLSFFLTFMGLARLTAQETGDSAPTGGPDDTNYKSGVRAYLDGDDSAAIKYLEQAVHSDNRNEKARRLLLKVYLRAIHSSETIKDSPQRLVLIKEARLAFPEEFNEKERGGSSHHKKRIQNNKRVSEPAPLPLSTPTPKASIDPNRMATPAIQIPAENKIPDSAPEIRRHFHKLIPWDDGDSKLFLKSRFFLALVFLLGMVVLCFFIFSLQNYHKTIMDQAKFFQDALKKEEAEKTALKKELEEQKEVKKRAEEMEKLKMEEERRMYAALDLKRKEEEKKLFKELAEKRRREEEKFKTSQSVPATPQSPLHQSVAKRQEEQILDMMANISPPERRATWDRIATQALNLYETSPADAVQFLERLSNDPSPWTRASIGMALNRIGIPETIDLLIKLRSDSDSDVQREALRNLKEFHLYERTALPVAYRQKVTQILQEELEKGDWIM